MKELTDRQRAILDWVVQFITQHDMPPTIREIGQRFKISSAGVFGHLKALEAKGTIRRGKMGARSLEVVGRSHPDRSDTPRVPLVGRIAAGVPLLAEENIEGSLAVDPGILGRTDGRHFALRVRGQSMIEAGILEGDLVIVRQQKTARDGDIVVALVGDEATLKRFYREGDRIRLQPANAEMEPIYVRDVTLQGVVQGLVRKMP